MPLTYTPNIGEDIADSFRRAIRMAWDNAQAVTFTFNGDTITVFQYDVAAQRVRQWREDMEARRRVYEASPEYRAAKAARIAEGQRLTTRAAAAATAAAADLSTLSVAVALSATLAECDHVDAHIPWRAYAQMLRAAGYIENEGVGRTDLEHAPVAFGRYIVGQAIACMLSGLAPHPMTTVFLARWRSLHVGAA